MIVILEKDTLSPRAIQHRLMSINRLHRTAVDTKISATGVHRSQHMILMHLYHSNQKVSQKDIAARFEISAAAVAVSLKKLESNGFIKRSCAESDNRFNEIEITEKGKQVVEYSHQVFEAIDNKTFEGISDSDKQTLVALLDKVIANLKSL